MKKFMLEGFKELVEGNAWYFLSEEQKDAAKLIFAQTYKTASTKEVLDKIIRSAQQHLEGKQSDASEILKQFPKSALETLAKTEQEALRWIKGDALFGARIQGQEYLELSHGTIRNFPQFLEKESHKPTKDKATDTYLEFPTEWALSLRLNHKGQLPQRDTIETLIIKYGVICSRDIVFSSRNWKTVAANLHGAWNKMKEFYERSQSPKDFIKDRTQEMQSHAVNYTLREILSNIQQNQPQVYGSAQEECLGQEKQGNSPVPICQFNQILTLSE